MQLVPGVQVFLCIVSLAISQGRTAGTTAQSTLSQAFAWSEFLILSLHETQDIKQQLVSDGYEYFFTTKQNI